MEQMSAAERSELWDRWEAGESQRSTARTLDRSPATVRTRLLASGRVIDDVTFMMPGLHLSGARNSAATGPRLFAPREIG